MASNSKLAFILDRAKESFHGQRPFVDTRLPLTSTKGQNGKADSFVTVPALWTKDGFKPQWKNLAVIASELESTERLSWWDDILVNLGIPLGIFVLDDSYFLKSRATTGRTQTEQIAAEDLGHQLSERNPILFTPRSLSAFRKGQLSFADTEDEVTQESFAFHTRYHARLSQSLENAITAAFMAELGEQSRARDSQPTSDTSSVYDSVLIVTIAFLAARILEDKGFFGTSQMPTDNVEALLKRTVSKTNGFFRKAFEELPRVSDQALQQLSVELGSRAIFTLIDHHDVAELYEKAIRAPLSTPELAALRTSLLDLQQYYTPIAIAERMLDLLPLERLRPEERRIFDPSAGSGTLLLAASQRLAAMTDLPSNRDSYLENHVSGNDLDRNANLLTRVRYVLSQETEGRMLPAPVHFSADNFEHYTKDTLPTKPRVIIANPPFGEQQNVQRATKFLDLVTEWLSEGDQFAVILPHAFLTGSTHGINKARQRLTERCHVSEVWQLPEGVIGVTARQAVCVVIGSIGKVRQGKTVVRSTISAAMAEPAREKGFLGEAWITEVGETSDHWETLLARPIRLPKRTVKLKDLYYVFTGVTPDKGFPPVAEPAEDVETKPYWKLGWKGPGRIWADPESVPPDERYIRYGSEYLEGPRLKNKDLFDRPKLMVGRSINRNSKDPLAACLDTIGLCPNVHTHCITTLESKGQKTDTTSNPIGWLHLSNEEKLLWLLGVLTSELACEISLIGRAARQLQAKVLRNFPLPVRIDQKIVVVVRQMVVRDQRREPLMTPDPLRLHLNELVEASYGKPSRVSTPRTGVTPEYEASQVEAARSTVTVTGQVRDISVVRGEVLLWMQGINDELNESWIPLPPEMPGWAIDGDIFTADLSDDIETFSELAERPRALREFRHTPRPYLTIEELEKGFATTQ